MSTPGGAGCVTSGTGGERGGGSNEADANSGS